MGWSDAWRISNYSYGEVAFQAIYALRQGNLPSNEPGDQLVAKARRRVIQSKLFVGFGLGVLALIAYLGLILPPRDNPIVPTSIATSFDPGLLAATILAGALLLQLGFLWWTTLQILPTYLGGGSLSVLETLPIDPTTLDQAALLTLLRLFDAPALTCLILTPLAVGLALHSIVAGLVMLVATGVALLFAITLAVVTGQFFLRRIRGSRSTGRSVALRWVFLVLWTLPFFAIYGFLSAAPLFLSLLNSLLTSQSTGAIALILFAFPFPFTTASAALGGATFSPAALNPTTLFAVGIGLLVYFLIAFEVGRYLYHAPRRLSEVPAMPTRLGEARALSLRPRAVPWAVLLKDLRTASRNPGYALLILLPLLEAASIGLVSLVTPSPRTSALSFGIGAVTTAALFATFFGPAFFAIEVMGYSYSRSLPLSERSVILGKISLVALIYLLASGIVLGLLLPRVFSPVLFVAFIAAEFPAVMAASFLEFGLLFRRARQKALPIVNLYTGAWWAIAVAVPGVVVAGIPVGVFQYLQSTSVPTGLGVMALIAVGELLAIGIPVLNRTGGHSA